MRNLLVECACKAFDDTLAHMVEFGLSSPIGERAVLSSKQRFRFAVQERFREADIGEERFATHLVELNELITKEFFATFKALPEGSRVSDAFGEFSKRIQPKILPGLF